MNAQTHGRKIPSIGDYYSATQLRADRWSALREAVEALSRHGVEGRQGQKILATVEELFEALAPIELYWAFPGASAFDHLRRLFDNRNFEDLMTVIRRVARALTSGAYRRRSIPLVADELDAEDYEDESAISPEARALGRPYFEVMIVDHVNEHQERFLKSSLLRDAPPGRRVHL